MKIKKLKIDNFASFSDFEVEFDGQVTRLVGVNGSGKTTVGLTAIWACLKGIAEKGGDGKLVGDRFRFLGPKKATADLELTLIDEAKDAQIKVKNRIGKDGNHISFEAPKGYPVSNGWLNELLSVAFLSAKNFTQLSSKEQALLLGIEVQSFDDELKGLKEEYTLINREYRNLGEVAEVEKAEEVTITDLLKQKEEYDEYNATQEIRRQQIQRAKERIADLKAEEKELQEKLADVRDRIRNGKEYLVELPEPEELKNSEEILQQIQNAEQINAKARRYKDYLAKARIKKEKAAELEENKAKQEKLAAERLKYIKGFNFGIDGLSVGEDGGLLLNDRPIKDPYFSKGELEIIVAKLYASMNPELKVRFIDDFEVLDAENQKKILESLLAEGFQIITAEVGESSEKDNVVLLRECKVVKSYKKEKAA